jgi:hypothetical protein
MRPTLERRGGASSERGRAAQEVAGRRTRGDVDPFIALALLGRLCVAGVLEPKASVEGCVRARLTHSDDEMWWRGRPCHPQWTARGTLRTVHVVDLERKLRQLV